MPTEVNLHVGAVAVEVPKPDPTSVSVTVGGARVDVVSSGNVTPRGNVSSAEIDRIKMLTQTEYDAIAAPDARTWYVIVEP